jgi:hypothetical protein
MSEIARLGCRVCGEETWLASAVAVRPLAPCESCGGPREIVELVADRRSGSERRGPLRLQRAWDSDPRSWFDRRQA